MKVKQAKLAQTIRGETSNLLESIKYDLEFDGTKLHATLKVNPRNYGKFIVFPANIAYIEVEEDKTAASQSGADEVAKAGPGRPKKQ